MRVILLGLLFTLNGFSLSERWTFEVSKEPVHFATGFFKTKHAVSLYEDLSSQDVEIPNEYDLRKMVPMQKIYDQGACGSCWAHSVTATVYDALAQFGEVSSLLSPQYLVDCARPGNYGCGGGTFEAFNFTVSPKGIPSLSDYPYTARNGRCQTKSSVGSILEWHYVGSRNQSASTSDLQKAILTHGELSVTVGADNLLMRYSGGVYNGCTRAGVNHMVNLVGWNNEGAVAGPNGMYPPGKGYWIMRNSWGEKWGEKGWGNIRYTGSKGNLCNNLADEAAFVKVIDVPRGPKVFTMDSKSIAITVTIGSGNKTTEEMARKTLQPFLNQLDKK